MAVIRCFDWSSLTATANLNPWTEGKVDTENPDRGPLLLISGALDHTVPWAIVNASYQQQGNKGVTEIVKLKGRGHPPTIDSGWRKVADTADQRALSWVVLQRICWRWQLKVVGKDLLQLHARELISDSSARRRPVADPIPN
jgi:hypothetical protein